MRRIKQFGKWRIFAKRPSSDPTLHPLLSAVKPELPPEGLLQSIERALEENEEHVRQRSARWPGPLILSTAAAVLVIAAFGLAQTTQRTTLVDPAGRAVALLERKNSTTTVRWLARAESGDMAWHIWGMMPTGGPVHLGTLDNSGVIIDSPERFTGLAMSLEENAFSETTPKGPVVILSPIE